MDDVLAELRSFLAGELRVPGADELAPDLALVRRGLIDSIELMRLVAFIEERWRIKLEPHEVLPANLGSLASMHAFIARKRAAAGASQDRGPASP
jgi:acyl carrier protein